MKKISFLSLALVILIGWTGIGTAQQLNSLNLPLEEESRGTKEGCGIVACGACSVIVGARS